MWPLAGFVTVRAGGWFFLRFLRICGECEAKSTTQCEQKAQQRPSGQGLLGGLAIDEKRASEGHDRVGTLLQGHGEANASAPTRTTSGWFVEVTVAILPSPFVSR
jgi:hypothetical protein